ncbi:unnamed protein product [Arabidopsis arenosa]|uniref:Uncharacterized protein n=1 Tax=Arabidopsis arenosa TaxID=38785 RepID=A0A8S2A836_ARAAE|nr:unnamed protein product [Arabidopsis arenosa]
MPNVTSKQEATSDPLTLTGLVDALPPYPDQLEGQRFYRNYRFLTTANSYKAPEPQQTSSPSWPPRDATDYLFSPQDYLAIKQSSYQPPEPQQTFSPAPTWPPRDATDYLFPPQDYLAIKQSSYQPPEPQPYKPTSPRRYDYYGPPDADVTDYYAPPDLPPYNDDVVVYEPPLPSNLVPMDCGYEGTFGKVGLHCYNLLNGTNFKYVWLDENHLTGLIYKVIKFYATDPTRTCEFLTRVVQSETENQGCLSFITMKCTLLPEENHYPSRFDQLAVDDFFKGDMPNSMPENTSDNLQYYELKESEVEEYKDWLHLYVDLALRTKLRCFRGSPVWGEPFELRKIIVQTRADVESKKKATAENAIFYMNFKGRGNQDCNAIIRRTTDGLPQHMSLEVKCLM